MTSGRPLLALLLTCLLLAGQPAAVGAVQYYCNGLLATQVGTFAGETIKGTAGNDVIVALGGNDTILGGPGADTICAGDGDDTVYGEDGDDLIYGAAGWDWLSGGNGNDTVVGGPGNDDIVGELGDDALRGEAGADQVFGGTGNDLLEGGGGNDTLEGGDGHDILFGGDDDDTLLGEAGDDLLDGEDDDDLLDGGPGNDQLESGQTGIDQLLGSDGDDELQSRTTDGLIDNTCDGGTGTNVLTIGSTCQTQTNIGTTGAYVQRLVGEASLNGKMSYVRRLTATKETFFMVRVTGLTPGSSYAWNLNLDPASGCAGTGVPAVGITSYPLLVADSAGDAFLATTLPGTLSVSTVAALGYTLRVYPLPVGAAGPHLYCGQVNNRPDPLNSSHWW